MFYFLINLMLCVILSLCLFWLLIRRLKINWERKNRHPLSYLMPVGLALILTVFTIRCTVPRLLDTVNIRTQTFQIEEVTLSETDIGWNTLRISDQTYYYSQWKFEPVPGTLYRITSTPLSRQIMAITPVSDSANAVAETTVVPVGTTAPVSMDTTAGS